MKKSKFMESSLKHAFRLLKKYGKQAYAVVVKILKDSVKKLAKNATITIIETVITTYVVAPLTRYIIKTCRQLSMDPDEVMGDLA